MLQWYQLVTNKICCINYTIISISLIYEQELKHVADFDCLIAAYYCGWGPKFDSQLGKIHLSNLKTW